MVIRLIKEFAKSKSDIINIISTKENIVKEHLITLYFWRDNESRKHWEGEIFGNIPQLPMLKGSKKYLSKNKILEYLYSYSDNIKQQTISSVEYIEYLKPDLPIISKYITYKDRINFKCFCDDFFNYVGDNLSKTGDIDKWKTYDLLDKLLAKYPLYLC